jgi:hypothetical protein
MDKNFKHLDNMKHFHIPPATEDEFNRRLVSFENKTLSAEKVNAESSYYDILDWNKKVHPNLELNDLTECLIMMVDYYDEANRKYESNKNK